jgi:hypothetical protein
MQALSTVSIVHTCTEGKRLHGLSEVCALPGSWPQGQARLNTLRKCCVTSRVLASAFNACMSSHGRMDASQLVWTHTVLCTYTYVHI